MNITESEQRFISSIIRKSLTEEQQKFIESGRCLKAYKHRYGVFTSDDTEFEFKDKPVEYTYHFDFGDYGSFDDDSVDSVFCANDAVVDSVCCDNDKIPTEKD
jgi:hypothetical protein